MKQRFLISKRKYNKKVHLCREYDKINETYVNSSYVSKSINKNIREKEGIQNEYCTNH